MAVSAADKKKLGKWIKQSREKKHPYLSQRQLALAVDITNASLSSIPAALWIALSIQPWQGTKHPSRAELSASTMASAFRRVMSPCQTASRGSLRTVGRAMASTTPFSSRSAESRASCTFRNAGSRGMGGRTFIRERKSRRWLASSAGNCSACSRPEAYMQRK